MSPIPNASTMIGASAIRGIEFTAVMKRLKDRAEPVRSPEDQPGDEARDHAGDEAEEGVLQRDRRRRPEIVLVARQTLSELAVEPAVEGAELRGQAALDQEDCRRSSTASR